MKSFIRFLPLLLFFSCSHQPLIEDSNILSRVEALSTQQIDTMKMERRLSLNDYSNLTGYAIRLQQDSLNADTSMKGEVLLAVVAKYFEIELDTRNLDREDAKVASLIKVFEKHDYYPDHPHVSNFIKLAHNACDCKYKYIYSRYRVANYFYFSLGALIIFLLISIANLFGLIKWKYRKKYNIFLGILLIILVTGAIIFSKTCNKYVKQTSFYGIRA